MFSKFKVFVGTLVAIAAIYGVFQIFNQGEVSANSEIRELRRDELELREDDVLYVIGENHPFSGKIVDSFSSEQQRSEIEVMDGKLHGISKGWYENGQVEVEEAFVSGVSHGTRTRWYRNGQKKSEAQIVEGKIEGEFLKWHENGRQAAKVNMSGGKADGLSESWYPSGKVKSRVILKDGEVVKRQFFTDEKLSLK